MQAWRAVRATLAADVRWRGTAPTPARRRPARALPASRVRRTRWYCPECHTTFSLLPDCLAARLPGTLAELEDAVATAERSPSVAEAARTLRFGRSEPAGAMRWLRRRIRLVRRALTAVRGLLPDRLAGCAATVLGFRARLGTGAVLPWLREMAAPQLPALPTPLGYAHRVPAVVNRVPTFQQRVGHDPPPTTT